LRNQSGFVIAATGNEKLGKSEIIARQNAIIEKRS